MKFLFKKKSTAAAAEKSEWKNTAALKIAAYILSIQHKWSEWMHQKVNHLSTKAKKILFGLFFLSQGCICIAMIIGKMPSWPQQRGDTQEHIKSPHESRTDTLKSDSSKLSRKVQQ